MDSEQYSYGENEIVNFVGKWTELEGIMHYCFLSLVHDLGPLLHVFSHFDDNNCATMQILLCSLYAMHSSIFSDLGFC